MSRRLQRYLDEIERTERKIDELQQHLKELRVGQKQEEELEMVRVLRSLKLESKDLMQVLNGLQNGTMSIKDLDPEEKTATDNSREGDHSEETFGHSVQKQADAESGQAFEGGNNE